MVTDRPDLNRRVSDKERHYIEKSIGQLVNKDSVSLREKMVISYKIIIESCRKKFRCGQLLKADRYGLL